MRTPSLLFALAALTVAPACAVESEGSFDDLQMRGAEVESKPCTYTQGYWKTHNIYAPQKKKQVPWPLWEDNLGCGDTWYNWLQAVPSEGDHWLILGHQWMAAMLNQAQGAPVPHDVQDAMWTAQIMLTECELADEDIEEAMAVAAVLDAYNNGEIGPGHCDDVLGE